MLIQKYYQTIQIGDTVNVYAQAFEMAPISSNGLTFRCKNAIIQKGNEQKYFRRINTKKIKGNVNREILIIQS